MAEKKEEGRHLEDEFGACQMATGSMHQSIEECEGCKYCAPEDFPGE